MQRESAIKSDRFLLVAHGTADEVEKAKEIMGTTRPVKRVARIAILALLACVSHAGAQSVPRPPCGDAAFPGYPDLSSSPAVRFWDASPPARDWPPPDCTGWTSPGFATLVTTVARFRFPAGAEGLLRRLGAISELAGTQYWSVSHKRWQTLIVDACALDGPNPAHCRPDFRVREMAAGQVLYFRQSDNISGGAIYRMRIAQATPVRLVFDVENAARVGYGFVTLFHPGEMQSVYFLDRESDDVWRYYSISRTGRGASRLVTGHAPSWINRAVAFYRVLAGIPTDQEPPAAR